MTTLQAFIQCLYHLRTRWRHREKEIFAGGIHYPTLVTAHHTWPPVSTSGAKLCWLDQLGGRLSQQHGWMMMDGHFMAFLFED
jgi:hypothetical protein